MQNQSSMEGGSEYTYFDTVVSDTLSRLANTLTNARRTSSNASRSRKRRRGRNSPPAPFAQYSPPRSTTRRIGNAWPHPPSSRSSPPAKLTTNLPKPTSGCSTGALNSSTKSEPSSSSANWSSSTCQCPSPRTKSTVSSTTVWKKPCEVRTTTRPPAPSLQCPCPREKNLPRPTIAPSRTANARSDSEFLSHFLSTSTQKHKDISGRISSVQPCSCGSGWSPSSACSSAPDSSNTHSTESRRTELLSRFPHSCS